MAKWLKDKLRKIAEANDLHIAPFREGEVVGIEVDNALAIAEQVDV